MSHLRSFIAVWGNADSATPRQKRVIGALLVLGLVAASVRWV